jgi:glycosyltransferase involved in cell wall biosynthesis
VKLLIFTPFAERLGGSDNILWNYLRNIDRDRVEPFVVFRGDGSFRNEVAGLGIRTESIPAGRLRQPLRTLAGVRELARLIRREQPDLILNWLSTAHVYGAPAAILAGMRDRLAWWQLDLDRGGPFDRVRVMTRLASMLPAIAVGGCSETIAEAERRRRPGRPAFSVLPGIEAPPFLAGEAPVQLPSGELIVGIVGRLFEWKGHDQLIKAVALLREDGVPAHGLIVGGGGHRGDDDYERRLGALVDELGVTEAITFTGQVADGMRYINLMDVFVNASADEPFGLVLLEAMAQGTPVVAADAAGPAEIVTHGVDGLLVPSNRAADLAAGIRVLWDDPDLRERMGSAGRSSFERRFTAVRMAREMDDRLAKLARTGVP